MIASTSTTTTILPEKKDKTKNQQHHWEQLLPPEESFLIMGIHPVSSLTWFEAPLDVERLRERAAEILVANPWLAGVLEKKGGNTGIAYSSIGSIEEARVKIAEKNLFNAFKPGEVEIYPDLQWEDQCKICESHPTMTLKQWQEMMSADRALWKISVFPTADGKYVGMTFNVSHIVADGYTSYRLFGALLGEPVPSMIVKRRQDTIEKQALLLGEKEARGMYGMESIAIGLRGEIGSSVLGRCFPNHWSNSIKTHEVDADKINRAKETEKGDAAFISTNDILTSWFLKGNQGFYYVNMRAKIADHSDDLAGNYENVVVLRKPDSATPELIRRSAKPLKRQVTLDQGWSNGESISMMSCGRARLITNMSSFYPKNVDPHFKVHYHGPMFRLPPTMAICILYNTGKPGRMGAFIHGSPSMHKTLDTTLYFVNKEQEEDF